MSEKYKFHDPEGIYFISPTIIHWIDLFTRKEFKHIIIESLAYCQQEKGLEIYAWVIMPSHLHLIISTKKEPLENIMRDFKKFVSKSIIKEIEQVNESRKECQPVGRKGYCEPFLKLVLDSKGIQNTKYGKKVISQNNLLQISLSKKS